MFEAWILCITCATNAINSGVSIFLLFVVAECVVGAGCCVFVAFVVGEVVFVDFGGEGAFVVLIQ